MYPWKGISMCEIAEENNCCDIDGPASICTLKKGKRWDYFTKSRYRVGECKDYVQGSSMCRNFLAQDRRKAKRRQDKEDKRRDKEERRKNKERRSQADESDNDKTNQ